MFSSEKLGGDSLEGSLFGIHLARHGAWVTDTCFGSARPMSELTDHRTGA